MGSSELGGRSIIKLAGIESISGLRSPGPTSGTFSARQRNFVKPDALRDTTSSHPSLERVRMVTTELPTIQVFSDVTVSTTSGGLVTISLRTEFAGRGSALAYEYRASQSKQTSVDWSTVVRPSLANNNWRQMNGMCLGRSDRRRDRNQT